MPLTLVKYMRAQHLVQTLDLVFTMAQPTSQDFLTIQQLSLYRMDILLTPMMPLVTQMKELSSLN